MSLSRLRSARSTRPDRRRVGGGWLSLFAMWMIFIGPLVSQSMPMDHHAGMSMPMDMDMRMPMAPAAPAVIDPAGQHVEASTAEHCHDGQLHADWERCGYCSLLFNCPALPQTLSPLSASRVPPPVPGSAPTRQGHALHAVFPGARSRAPPPSIVV
ncbi:DUF2946 domain-containing protein [Pseudomonas sp. S75]|uniref:DUF2946 domain-containing protein n=1 Tax=unclassified Pseudomonas TaxID=196821 RepID=UPI0019041350|nr:MULTISPECIES: DUF2946 domain-containing protein [unclassified Pseudomonas]MBJ9974748.1 DUF2946 domain-containing protein [Pseudomonas sp. S30]MBK0152496.1 DUF2946 domain-containing protein [Pseudomonas sp. S75]